MARLFIADLQPGTQLESQVFLVVSKDLRTATNGSLYIHAVLADRTGKVNARMWQASEVLYNALPEGGFVELKGRAENYKGNIQFIIDAIRPIDQQKVDHTEFLKATSQDVDKMWDRTVEILRNIKNKHVRLLIKQFLSDDDFVTRYKRAPAATVMHHAYLGGLCEHTLNVLEIALAVIPRYPQVSLDLVLAGLFLHDAGKTEELRYETAFGYTDEGQLVGHIVIGAMWVAQRCDEVEKETGQPFPSDIKHALQHLILSHHGQYAFGSPKLPAMPEAIAMHHIDNIDAKLNQYLGLIDSDRDAESDWTNYDQSLGTKIYKRDVLGVRSALQSDQ